MFKNALILAVALTGLVACGKKDDAAAPATPTPAAAAPTTAAPAADAGIGAGQTTALTDATLRGWALGGEGFVADLQKLTARRSTPMRPGRPPGRPVSQE